MSSSSRPTASVPEQDTPLSAGSSMPLELAADMARAGQCLDLGDRIGARKIVRRVLDRATVDQLAELADLAADLGLGDEDLGTAAVARQVLYRLPPRGSAVRIRPVPAPPLTPQAGQRGTWPPRDARRRSRDGDAAATSYLATRGGVVDDPQPQQRPDGYTIDYDRVALDGLRAPVCLGCHLERTPADVRVGDGVCADCRADGLGRDPMQLRCEAVLAAAVRRGPWARRELRRLWDAADAAGRASIEAFVAANNHRVPPAPKGH